jgi:F-type H+-transporting ATPase subunit epsilon
MEPALIDCTVATPEGPVFDGKARSVVVPAADGELGILPRHAPLIAALGCGELRIEEVNGEKGRYFLDGGFVQVVTNRVTVLATTAEVAKAVDPAEAQKRVEALLENPPPAASSIEARAAYQERLRAARVRKKLAG